MKTPKSTCQLCMFDYKDSKKMNLKAFSGDIFLTFQILYI